MSNALAIAAVTSTLRNLLTLGVTPDPDLADTVVTTQTPDKAQTNGSTANQLNVFLYLTTPNAAWRNLNIPPQVKSGETAVPPLALTLSYLITAYGRDGDVQRPFSHLLLGRAMSVLHDHPVLGPDEIKSALPGTDLQNQIERVRFTIQPLSIEEIFRLWSGFQTQYRLSVAYEVSVVLIESTRSAKTPLPVLARSKDDQGISSQPNLIPPFPAIDPIAAPVFQPGDVPTITGNHLGGDTVVVHFMSRWLAVPRDVPAAPGGTDQQISVVIPNDPPNFPAGAYMVTVTVTLAGETRTTNERLVQVAPKITTPLPLTVARGSGPGNLRLGCSPDIVEGQRVSLLLGGQEIPADPPDPAAPNASQASFTTENAQPGDYLVRLRVDGVDSNILVDRTALKPSFDQTQKVTITP